jgi:hypothetical protein
MSKFVEDSSLKLQNWIVLGETDVLKPILCTVLSLEYYRDNDEQKINSINKKIIKTNNLISKSDNKVLKLKELTASYFGESVSYLPLLVNPDNNMKYIFSIPGVSNSNRDNLYEHFYGKNIKMNFESASKAYYDFAENYMLGLLCLSRCNLDDKRFEVEMFNFLYKEITDVAIHTPIIDLQNKIKNIFGIAFK